MEKVSLTDGISWKVIIGIAKDFIFFLMSIRTGKKMIVEGHYIDGRRTVA